MDPVLLDQRRMSFIIVAVLCALLLAFYGGYLTAQSGQLPVPDMLESLELDLPPPDTSVSDENAPEPPAVIAPGADIDVDAADQQASSESVERVESTNEAGKKPIPAPAHELAAVKPTTSESAASVEEAKPAAPPSSLLASDADADSADYTIQVGIYGSRENAERQLLMLKAKGIEAYYQSYQTQANAPRYRVRFGYFSSRSRGQAALQAWQTLPAVGSAILVKLRR